MEKRFLIITEHKLIQATYDELSVILPQLRKRRVQYTVADMEAENE